MWRWGCSHGFHLGHLRLGFGKSHFYEFDSRVPFLVRGPGIAAGSTIAAPSGNVDLAPTFIELAGGAVPPTMDGKSMVPILQKRCERLSFPFLPLSISRDRFRLNTREPVLPMQDGSKERFPD